MFGDRGLICFGLRFSGSRSRMQGGENVQQFRGGLVFKAHRLCVSLNSRLESNKEVGGGHQLEHDAVVTDHASQPLQRRQPHLQGSYLRRVDLCITQL